MDQLLKDKEILESEIKKQDIVFQEYKQKSKDIQKGLA